MSDAGTRHVADLVWADMTVACSWCVRFVVLIAGAALTLAGCAPSADPVQANRKRPAVTHAASTSLAAHSTVGGCALAGAVGARASGCPAPATFPDAARHDPALASSARDTCRRTFPGQVVLGWASTTVDQMRAYQFGGPVAHRPLRDVFPASPGTRRGAWCLLRDTSASASLWAALGPAQRKRAITVSGPGATHHLGPMSQPPQVP